MSRGHLHTNDFPMKQQDAIVQPILGTFLFESRPQRASSTSSQPMNSKGENGQQSDSLTTLAGQAAQAQWAHINEQFREAEREDDQGTVDEDGGVIRCICGCDDDDGFTIQCDRCLVWQHCACFGMSQDSVPDEYLCEQCDPRPVNIAFAQAHQRLRREEEIRKEEESKKVAHSERNAARRVSLGLANSRPEEVTAPLSSQSLALDTNSTERDHRGTVPSPFSELPILSSVRSRKTSQQLDPSTLTHSSDVPPSTNVSMKTVKRKTGKGAVKRSSENVPLSGPAKRHLSPIAGTAVRNERPEIDAVKSFEVAEKMEAWHVEFTPIARSIIVEAAALESLAAALLDWEEGSPLQASTVSNGTYIAPVAPKQLSGHMRSSDDGVVLSPGPSLSPAPPTLEGGLSAVGNECVPIELSGPQALADLGVPTYVKMISESASSAIFANTTPITMLPTEPQRPWAASRSFSRPVMHGLFAGTTIQAGTFVSEYCGELLSARTYRKSPVNQYSTLGVVKPHVHLLPPPFDLAIDARRFGGEARFIRSSCHPNAVLRPILFRRMSQNGTRVREAHLAHSVSPTLGHSEINYRTTGDLEHSTMSEPELRFGIFAIADIHRTHEITLGWEWDDEHIVHFLPDLVDDPYVLPPPPKKDDSEVISPSARNTAALVAFAEKGQYPYAGTVFSAKMNSFVTSLLGCTLCACIGSAAPPGGSASANNGRKQDCVVAQMLRVGYGMSLHNVATPGNKTNRRVRLPDFSPLVGIRRWWRPLSMPDTPEGTNFDSGDDVGSNELVPGKLRHQLAAGPLTRVTEADYLAAVRWAENRSKLSSSYGEGEEMEDRSDASSLTDALPGLTDMEDDSTPNDLIAILRHPRPDAYQYDGPSILPLKKRISGTRIKAARSDEESEEVVARRAALHIAVTGKRKRRSSKVTGVLFDTSLERHSKQRQAKSRILQQRARTNDERHLSTAHKTLRGQRHYKKRRTTGGMPSSPLTSVPSGESRSSLSPAPDADQEEEVDDLDRDLTADDDEPLRGPDNDDEYSYGDESELDLRTARAQVRKSLANGQQRSSIKSAVSHNSGTWKSERSGDSEASSPSDTDGASASGSIEGGRRQKELRSHRERNDSQRPRRHRMHSSEQSDGGPINDEIDNRSSDSDTIIASRHRFSRIPRTHTPGAADVSLIPQHSPVHQAVKETSPPPPPQPEPPRATLSLADYKKRLAQRRTQETSTSNNESTAGPAFPSASSGVQTCMSTPGGSVSDINNIDRRVSFKSEDENAQQVQAGGVFASISAPIALRSVDIPKSPPTEPRGYGTTVLPSSSNSRLSLAFEMPLGASPGSEVSPTYSSRLERASSLSGNSGIPPLASIGRSFPSTQIAPGRHPSIGSQLIGPLEARASSPTMPSGPQWGSRSGPSNPIDTVNPRPSAAQSSVRPVSGFRPIGEVPPGRDGTVSNASTSSSGPSSFNPPRGPRALLNASAAGTANQPVAHNASSPVAQRETLTRSVSHTGLHGSAAARAGSISSDGGGSVGAAAGTSPPLRDGPNARPLVARHEDRDFAGVPKGPARMPDGPSSGNHGGMRSYSPDGRPAPPARINAAFGPSPTSNASWGDRVPPPQRPVMGSGGGAGDNIRSADRAGPPIRGYGNLTNAANNGGGGGGRSDGRGAVGGGGWSGGGAGGGGRGWGARVRGSRGGGRGRGDKWHR